MAMNTEDRHAHKFPYLNAQRYLGTLFILPLESIDIDATLLIFVTLCFTRGMPNAVCKPGGG